MEVVLACHFGSSNLRGMGSAEVVIWESGRDTGDGTASSFLLFLL